jgi:hypothetical protein
VALIYFEARPGPNSITVDWATGTELELVAFTLHRSTSATPPDWGEPVYEAPATGGVEGATYRYVDMSVESAVVYYYLLRTLAVDATVTEFGPVSGSAGFTCAAVSEIPRAECEALAELYERASGPDWTRRDGWLATETPCSWYGVTCRAGHVRALNLPCNRVSGALPASLRDLTWLQVLDLAGGEVVVAESGAAEIERCVGQRLGGSIPGELGELAYLERLDLAANELTGGIPPQIGKLAYLESLSLSGNRLSGAIPPQLGLLTNLEQLDLIGNELSGAIPAHLGNLKSLRRLDAADNRLEQHIPAEFGKLSNLRSLDLSHNRLTGAVPSTIGTLGALYRLDLSSNELSGGVPARLAQLLNLERLRLRDNALSGPLPRELAGLSLSELAFDSTRLCEPPGAAFQAWLAAIPQLRRTGATCSEAYLPVVFAQPHGPAPIWADRYFLPPGGCATVYWQVENALEVYLNGEGVPGQGSRIVCPVTSSKYVLSVTWSDGTKCEYVVAITVTAGPWIGIDGAGNFYRGNPEARVKLEEFMDLGCPFCARHALQTGPLIYDAYVAKGDVMEVFRNYPLDIHPNAITAARAAYCAGQQGPELFWSMRDWLFRNQTAWSGSVDAPAQFRSVALGLGAGAHGYDACIASTAPDAQIERDMKEAAARGLRGTPYFLINDWTISGAAPYQVFADAIEKAKAELPPPVTATVTVPTQAPTARPTLPPLSLTPPAPPDHR